MGCLNVQLENTTICDVAIDTTGKNAVSKLSTSTCNTFLLINTQGSHYIVTVNIQNKNKKVAVKTVGKKPTISVSAGLVCQTSLGEYKVFYVAEGPFLVEEGYFRVGGM